MLFIPGCQSVCSYHALRSTAAVNVRADDGTNSSARVQLNVNEFGVPEKMPRKKSSHAMTVYAS